MLHTSALRSLCWQPFAGQLAFLQSLRDFRAYSTRSNSGDDPKDLDAARQWFAKFNKNTIPESISNTDYVKASGAGGQKVNKTSSKAHTTWKMTALEQYVPKVLFSELQSSRYYVGSSNSIAIDCDSHRNRTENRAETLRRLDEEIKILYRQRVPGVTSLEQQAKVEKLLSTPRGGWHKFFTSNHIHERSEIKAILRQAKIDKEERRRLMAKNPKK